MARHARRYCRNFSLGSFVLRRHLAPIFVLLLLTTLLLHTRFILQRLRLIGRFCSPASSLVCTCYFLVVLAVVRIILSMTMASAIVVSTIITFSASPTPAR